MSEFSDLTTCSCSKKFDHRNLETGKTSLPVMLKWTLLLSFICNSLSASAHPHCPDLRLPSVLSRKTASCRADTNIKPISGLSMGEDSGVGIPSVPVFGPAHPQCSDLCLPSVLSRKNVVFWAETDV